MQRSTFAMTRIFNVIDKVKKSRAVTAVDFGMKTLELESF
jgi:hypothetical protein